MILTDLMDQLIQGELALLPLGEDEDTGEIRGGYAAILPHINLALTAIHKRLYIREESLVLRLDVSINKYRLQTKFAVSDTGPEPIKYIIDTVGDPFLGNSLKIEKVVDSEGEELLLNNSTTDNPVFTPTSNVLVFDIPVSNREYVITFRANHPKIDLDNNDPEDIELDIPDFVLEPLLYFIAARVHASYPSLGDGTSESFNYMQKYELAMAELSDQGLVDTSQDGNQRLEDNGWV